MGRFDGKTEKATPQRRRQARREGTIARSQEVGGAAALLAAVLALQVFGPTAVDVSLTQTRTIIAGSGSGEVPFERLASSAGMMLAGGIAPLAAAVVAAALIAGFGQVGFAVSGKAAMPKLSNLHPRKGIDKLRPSNALWELFRAMLKLGLLTAILWAPVRTWVETAHGARSLDAGVSDVADQVWIVLLRAVALAVVVGLADYLWNRRKVNRQMRMSKDEVRREHRDNEGDPMLKSQRRRRAQDLSRNRMIGSVATADVVVTNPTHIAIALSYGSGDTAPRVVARGADKLAARIRKEAYRNGVPVTEDRPLARALYRRCKVGDHVPAALFEAVAVVLAIAYRRRGRRLAGASR